MILKSELEFFDLAKNATFIAVDCEGDGKDVREPGNGAITMGVTLAFRAPNGSILSKYFPFHHKIGQNQPEFFEPVKDLLENHCRDLFGNSGPIMVGHNFAKHDVAALKIMGIDVTKKFYYDTLSCVHWLKEDLQGYPGYSLDALSKLYGGQPKAKSKRMSDIIELFGWGNIPVKEMTLYAENDGVITLELWEKIVQEFHAQFSVDLWRDELEWILYAMNPMEATGVLVDQEFCKKKIAIGKKILAECVSELNGLNPGSPKDLYKLLIEELRMPVFLRTDQGRPSFKKEAMKKYDEILSRSGNRLAKTITRYRGWRKVISTNYEAYLRLLGNDGRLRPNYKFHGTSSSRLSCGEDSDGGTTVKSPNLQNIPKISEKEWDGDLKEAFIPDEGYELVEFDYSNLELRITAAYSNDPLLVDTFKSGRNVFDDMARLVGWPRDHCKTFVYATGYNAGDDKIARTFGISYEDAKQRRADFFSKYAKMAAFKKYVSGKASQSLGIKYWTGRRRHFRSRKEAAHLSFNALIQGGAAELVKNRMTAVGKVIDWHDCKMVLQIHDSLVFLVRKGTEDYWYPIIKKTMEDVPSVLSKNVPFAVEAKIWGKKETIDIAV